MTVYFRGFLYVIRYTVQKLVGSPQAEADGQRHTRGAFSPLHTFPRSEITRACPHQNQDGKIPLYLLLPAPLDVKWFRKNFCCFCCSISSEIISVLFVCFQAGSSGCKTAPPRLMSAIVMMVCTPLTRARPCSYGYHRQTHSATRVATSHVSSPESGAQCSSRHPSQLGSPPQLSSSPQNLVQHQQRAVRSAHHPLPSREQ